jgi:hypothetical protein
MRLRVSILVVVAALAGGCYTVEKGYRYEYDGRILRADGQTPVKGVTVRLARAEAVDARAAKKDAAATGSNAAAAAEPADKTPKTRTRSDGRYNGALETVKGWKYGEGWGFHTGPTRAPDPPVLDEVIVYVQEKGSGQTGYRVRVPAEAQAEAISGVRKVHVPDLLLPETPTTRATTRAASTGPAGQ